MYLRLLFGKKILIGETKHTPRIANGPGGVKAFLK
jgi:hypothetical protein